MTLSQPNKMYPWQHALSQAISDPAELLRLVELDPALLPAAEAAAKVFPLKVPLSFIARMQKGDPHDPLLRQVLPLGAELVQTPGYSADPLAENKVNPIPGVLHKYQSRVLLTLTGACAVNCRYCFRRHFPYQANNPGQAGWQQAFQYIAKDPTIHEVILSGGDPLVVSDKRLADFVQALAEIPHLQRLRIHSRLPIVLPERITPDFLATLTATRLHVVMIVHCNHPQEVNDEVRQALAALRAHGIMLLNQAVLLKGINDDVDILANLSETLFAAGVLPYYLYVLDKVQGAAHFDLPRTVALELHQQLQSRLSGYLVPRLAIEQPGAPSKLNLTPNDLLYTD